MHCKVLDTLKRKDGHTTRPAKGVGESRGLRTALDIRQHCVRKGAETDQTMATAATGPTSRQDREDQYLSVDVESQAPLAGAVVTQPALAQAEEPKLNSHASR
jgi:hypothetical protein